MQNHIFNSFSAFLVIFVSYVWRLETSFEVMLHQIRLMNRQKQKEVMVEDEVMRIQTLSNHEKAVSQNQFELRISATCRKVKGLKS